MALCELNLRPMSNEDAIGFWFEGRFSDASETYDYFSLPMDELASHDWIGFSTIRSNGMLTRLDLA